jgi:hypothetical protein
MLLAIRNEGDGERGVREFGSTKFGIAKIGRGYVCAR